MSRGSNRHDAPAPSEELVRHRRVPTRQLDDKLVVARPSDGAPVVLAPTAAIVWLSLENWTTPNEIDRQLAEIYPSIAPADREAGRAQILVALSDDDLLERF